jgi:hypothetical protein
MKCGAVETGLWPQRMTSLLCSTSWYGGAQRAPRVDSTAISAAAPQMLRSSVLTPRRFHSRPLATAICTSPSVPL